MTKFIKVLSIIDSCIHPGQLETARKMIELYKEPNDKKLLYDWWDDKLHRLNNYDLRRQVSSQPIEINQNQ